MDQLSNSASQVVPVLIQPLLLQCVHWHNSQLLFFKTFFLKHCKLFSTCISKHTLLVYHVDLLDFSHEGNQSSLTTFHPNHDSNGIMLSFPLSVSYSKIILFHKAGKDY